MKMRNWPGLLFVLCLAYTACKDPMAGEDPWSKDLEKYQNIGAGVAARKWSQDYDCSNFSTQFYQNCYKAGLPCRVRLGTSGGPNFSEGNHAWNSVKLNGQWVNWEPQKNSVYDGHTQTKTPLDDSPDSITSEDLTRIIYELVGRHVPSNVIDVYEIDNHWSENSPFYRYFLSLAYCLSDTGNPDIDDFISDLQPYIPHDNSGGMFISEYKKHLFFFFKYNSKYYGINNLEENDPVEGRNVMKENRLTPGEIISSGVRFTRLNVNLRYETGWE
ncbi:MAG: hypothetical protein LBF78_12240 [Treponema sp.]|jgi:hypothetical protein|nr:hypothetical protein [Treponema sp.]